MFCLIRPPGADAFRMASDSLAPPLGAAYVAAAIEASGRRVHVIDAVTAAPRNHIAYFRGYLIGLAVEEIVRRIPEDADFVGSQFDRHGAGTSLVGSNRSVGPRIGPPRNCIENRSRRYPGPGRE